MRAPMRHAGQGADEGAKRAGELLAHLTAAPLVAVAPRGGPSQALAAYSLWCQQERLRGKRSRRLPQLPSMRELTGRRPLASAIAASSAGVRRVHFPAIWRPRKAYTAWTLAGSSLAPS